MSDPPRLLREGSSLERALLESSANDRADEGAKQRALATLGLGAATAIASKATLAPKAIVKASLWKLTIVKIATTVVVAGAAGGIAYKTIARPVIAPPPAASITTRGQPLPTESAPTSELPTSSTLIVEPPPSAPTHRTGPAASEAPSPVPDHEVDWIDRAQTALARDPARALAIVDAYRAQVSPRVFDEEADVIAIEASKKSGDLVRAKREASTFAALYPKSAYRAKVLALVPPEN
ncbi:MAG: hypothetical protein ABI551_15140 [Polyangiaceae bacterium]